MQYEPVGCRDEETMLNLREKGIEAYLSGCITALFPQREISEKQDKVVFVDVPQEVMEYIPKEMKEQAVSFSSIEKITRTTGEEYATAEEINYFYGKARELLTYYRDRAKVVVTSRLHVAVPCMAMGIPVILVRNGYGFDGRYAWVDKFLPLYDFGDYENIDWNPKRVEYEEIKALTKRALFGQLTARFQKKKDIYRLSEFYETRERKEYNKTSRKALLKLNLEDSFEYAIWGSITEAQILKKLLKEVRPKAKLVKVIDKNLKGAFEGIEMQTPDSIEKDNLIYFVVAVSAFADAEEKLMALNNTYVLTDFRKTEWRIRKERRYNENCTEYFETGNQ